MTIRIDPWAPYMGYWCTECQIGDSFASGLVRVLESVDAHVRDRHRSHPDILIEVPHSVFNWRTMVFGETEGRDHARQVRDRLRMDGRVDPQGPGPEL